MKPFTCLSCQRYDNHKAFSIIEVTIAVAILALVLGGMLAVFHQGAKASLKTRQQAIAYNLLREKLEELSNTNPVLFTVSNPTCSRPPLTSCLPRPICPCSSYTSPPDEPIATVGGFPDFEREVDITCPYLGNNNLARIQVIVWWDNGRYSQSVETLKANY